MGDRSDSEITANSPIGAGLDEFCRLFKSTCADLGISESPGAIEEVILLAASGTASGRGGTALFVTKFLADIYRCQKSGAQTHPCLTRPSSGLGPSFQEC